MDRRVGGRVSSGLLILTASVLILVAGFDLTAVASIGSAVALMIFTLVTIAHLRVRSETGASTVMLVLGLLTAGITLVTFVFTTLIHEPGSLLTLAGILLGSLLIDLLWTRRRDRAIAQPEPS
jgi:K+-sensing histidine kinase KdpD